MGEAYQTARQNYINNSLDAWRNNQANKPKAHKKTEAEKTEDIYKRLIKQQKEQIALAGQNTELAKMKYQVSQGELSTLSEAQKKTLLQNAALIDQKKIREQLAAYESSLADSNASARASDEAQLLGYGEGSRMRERLQEMWSIRQAFEQKNNELLRQYQAGEIEEALWKQEKSLNEKYLEERLSDQQDYYAKADALRSDWNAGLQEGLTKLGRQCHRLCFAGGRCCRFHYGRAGIKYFRCTGRKCCGLAKLGEFNSPGSFKNSDERCHR